MTRVFPPGSRIGILGGGQLGRMLATAGAEMGLSVHIYCPEEVSPAAQAAAGVTIAPYEDHDALTTFAGQVDVITYEFENIPSTVIEHLEKLRPVQPGHTSLYTSQDRLSEKTFLRTRHIATAPFARVDDLASLEKAVGETGYPAILKTRRLGYDGKGQIKLERGARLQDAWNRIGKVPAVLEGFVPFEREISVITARNANGDVQTYDIGENVHKNHILHTTTVPATIDEATARKAVAIAEKITTELNHVGILATEMFHLPGAVDGNTLIVNEIAPRVHNSGHWTQDACLTSQFEQHLRAICGWPLASPARHSNAVMTNLVGTDADHWHQFAAQPGCRVHLYGKTASPGRKTGHVNRLSGLIP